MFPPKAFSADSFQFRQVGFASIEKSRLMQYTVHVLPYYPTNANANAIVAHYLPYRKFRANFTYDVIPIALFQAQIYVTLQNEVQM